MTLSLVGKRIGNYDIQAKIGEGGMGMVYLGLHPQIGKRVAIKVLHEELSSQADVVGRFFTEARSVNDISHPNIVDIVDFGDITLEGVVLKYIIMEYLDGESLAARIRREGVTIRETMSIIAQCADALAASHAKGVIHRDLKPENIYLLPRGGDRNYVKLLDFGIAKLTGDGGNAALSSRTRTGMVIGTPAYMSPEQCEGRGLIDHRSDIYALGVVMYELLTGRVPFPGDGFGEVLVAHLTREPELPTQLNQNIPPEIEAIVLHCMKKDRTQRFQSMNELLMALQDPGMHYQMWRHSAQLPAGAVAGNALMSTVMSTGQPSSGAVAAWNAAGAGSGALPVGSMALPLSSGNFPVGTGHLPMGSGGFPVGTGPQPVGAMGGGMSSLANLPVGNGTIALLPDSTVPAPPGFPGTGTRPIVPGLSDGRPVVGASGPRPTTLSGASGEAAGGRRPAPVLLGFAGAIALGVVAVVGFKALDSKTPVVQRPDTPIKTPVKTPVRKPPTPPPGPDTTPPRQPQQVTIQIASDPPAAVVFRAGQPGTALGKTPLRLPVDKGAPLVLRLHLDGFGDAERTIPTTTDQRVQVALEKLAPPPGPAAGPDNGADDGADKKHHRRHHRRGGGSKGDGNELLKPIF